jgi:hypothetical protein
VVEVGVGDDGAAGGVEACLCPIVVSKSSVNATTWSRAVGFGYLAGSILDNSTIPMTGLCSWLGSTLEADS